MKSIHNFDDPWGEQKKSSQYGSIFEDLMKKSKEKSMGFGGGQPSEAFYKFIIALVAVIALLGWLATGLYTVQPDEEAVVLRFGKYNRTSNSGLNYKLPDPIESVTKISVTSVKIEEIGFRSGNGRNKAYDNNDAADVRNVPQESQMLTGDENIIDIDCVVHWKISNAKDFLFNIRDLQNENTVKTAAESAMREAIGQSKIADALAEERFKIEQEAKKLLQEILDSYKMGVDVVRVQMLRVEPPADVIDAYRDVQSARADFEKDINDALSYRNYVVPVAAGEAEKMRQDAEGYKTQVVANAAAESSRFTALYNEYKAAKEPVRKRMFLEAMQNILVGANKIIIDNKSGSVPILGVQDLLPKIAPTIAKSNSDNKE